MIARISIADIPEVLHALRCELANLLREAAMDEDPRVARRLREIAAVFEAGASEADGA